MFYGRHHELSLLKGAISSRRAELVIVYGRRRVGKSALLQRASTRKGDLYFEALENTPAKKQIAHFLLQLAEQTATPLSTARDWREAFEVLSFHINKGKHYVVLDELPWMASRRTELVSLLKYFWDNRWKKNPGLTLVLCGSIASFMVRHVVHSSALHNRKTLEMRLPPLPAAEARQFFRGLRSKYEVAKFLMVFGGIPKYLEQIDPAASLAQNLDHLCFQKHGFFLNELQTVFKEQFKVTANYERIVRALADRSGPREQLAKRLKMATGGGLTGYLETLEQAEFIKTFSPASVLGKGVKTRKLVLWDEWLRFYFTWVEPNLDLIRLNEKPGLCERLCGAGLDSYFGLCFEQLCMKNLPRLFSHMGLDFQQVVGFGPFFRQRRRDGSGDQGLQIDLLVRRRGQVLTLVECKFSSRPTGVSVVDEVQRKIKFLRAPASYTVERVLLCAGEVTSALQRHDYFHHILGLEALL